jgi:D-sedoheptulose 7-phosphate isomerase
MSHQGFTEGYLDESIQVIKALSIPDIERTVDLLATVRREGGRVFVLGVGGSAAAASHMVNDLRKLCGLESYAPTDNAPELTARINDEGWDSCFAGWLKASRLNAKDAVFVFSVGGGDAERNISPNLVQALLLAKQTGARILGVVGRQGGFTATVANACVLIPVVNPDRVTPHTEAFHAVVAPLIVTHPGLKAAMTKWESSTKGPNCL